MVRRQRIYLGKRSQLLRSKPFSCLRLVYFQDFNNDKYAEVWRRSKVAQPFCCHLDKKGCFKNVVPNHVFYQRRNTACECQVIAGKVLSLVSFLERKRTAEPSFGCTTRRATKASPGHKLRAAVDNTKRHVQAHLALCYEASI